MSITITPRTYQVTIYHGDDQARIADLVQRIGEAKEREGRDENGKSRRAGAVPDSVRLTAEHDALVVEAKERAVPVTLQALGRKQWRSLVAAHPPREGNDEDKAVGVDESAFPDALVPASIVEPKFDIPADRDAFLDSLSDAQFGQLYSVAFYLNRSFGEAPKALSSPSPSSDETSN